MFSAFVQSVVVIGAFYMQSPFASACDNITDYHFTAAMNMNTYRTIAEREAENPKACRSNKCGHTTYFCPEINGTYYALNTVRRGSMRCVQNLDDNVSCQGFDTYKECINSFLLYADIATESSLTLNTDIPARPDLSLTCWNMTSPNSTSYDETWIQTTYNMDTNRTACRSDNAAAGENCRVFTSEAACQIKRSDVGTAKNEVEFHDCTEQEQSTNTSWCYKAADFQTHYIN
eukprot:Pgem_evm1s5287